VQYAVNQKKVDGYDYKKGDQIWCIFDRDSFPSQQFNDALSLAGQKGIKVAYSNEAFELWYILHFEFLNTGITRAAYIAKLTKLLNKPYEKNSHEIYDLLEPWQATAIANAKRLLTTYNPSKPEQDNPSTTVHLLIEELRKYIR